MIMRYRAALNGKQLDAVANGIIIKDISYQTPALQYAAASLSGRNGQFIQGMTRGTASVTITLEIHEQAVHIRQDVCRKIQQWALHGGEMTTNDRPGQRIYVKPSVMPSIESVKRWTGDIQIVFTAYEKPYWEDIVPKGVRCAVGENKTLYVGGTMEKTQVNVTVKNGGESTIQSLTVTAGESFFVFDGLGLESDEELEIGHDENGLLYIRVNGESRMDRRTAESSDDLEIMSCEVSGVSIVADGTASAAFVVRGRYA